MIDLHTVVANLYQAYENTLGIFWKVVFGKTACHYFPGDIFTMQFCK